MILRYSDEEISEILCKSFDSYQKYGAKFDTTRNVKSHDAFDHIKKKLTVLGDLKEGRLTHKGLFTSKIYCEEFLFGEIFFGKFHENLDSYQLALLIGCLCFEYREDTPIKKVYPDKSLSHLKSRIREHNYLRAEKRFEDLITLTALIYPCFHGEDIFDVIDRTQLPEGDLLRFYRTVLDRVSQIEKATDNPDLRRKMDDCTDVIKRCIKLVDIL
jgi:superfamily II RNA helicase